MGWRRLRQSPRSGDERSHGVEVLHPYDRGTGSVQLLGFVYMAPSVSSKMTQDVFISFGGASEVTPYITTPIIGGKFKNRVSHRTKLPNRSRDEQTRGVEVVHSNDRDAKTCATY